MTSNQVWMKILEDFVTEQTGYTTIGEMIDQYTDHTFCFNGIFEPRSWSQHVACFFLNLL